MNDIIKHRTNRVLVAFGLYLLYELANKVIDSNYNFKVNYDDKSIVLQKEPIISPEINDTIIEQNT